MRKSIQEQYPLQAACWSDKNDCTPESVASKTHMKFLYNCYICDTETSFRVSDYARRDKERPVLCKECRKSDSVAKRYPKAAAIWDHSTNRLKPEEVPHGTDTKFYFVCKRCKYSFDSIPYSVGKSSERYNGCPYCSGKKTCDMNSLEKNYPQFKEIYSENNSKVFENLTICSNYKANWICLKGHGEYCRMVSSQVHSGGICPKCKNNGTSLIEQNVYAQLYTIFKNVSNRVKLQTLQIKYHNNQEADILLQDEKIVIEIDGGHWHRFKENKDREKNALLNKAGYTVIRLRDKRLGHICDNDIVFDDNHFHKRDIDRVLERVVDITLDLSEETLEAIEAYRKLDDLIDNEETRELMRLSLVKDSIVKTHPKLCEEWDYEKNGSLVPENFLAGSNIHVHWICKNAHRWQKSINDRALGNKGCGRCSGKIMTYEHSLANKRADIAQQWDHEKNRDKCFKNGKSIQADTVGIRSNIKVWWICPIHKLSYEQVIQSRTNGADGCPKCKLAKR